MSAASYDIAPARFLEQVARMHTEAKDRCRAIKSTYANLRTPEQVAAYRERLEREALQEAVNQRNSDAVAAITAALGADAAVPSLSTLRLRAGGAGYPVPAALPAARPAPRAAAAPSPAPAPAVSAATAREQQEAADAEMARRLQAELDGTESPPAPVASAGSRSLGSAAASPYAFGSYGSGLTGFLASAAAAAAPHVMDPILAHLGVTGPAAASSASPAASPGPVRMAPRPAVAAAAPAPAPAAAAAARGAASSGRVISIDVDDDEDVVVVGGGGGGGGGGGRSGAVAMDDEDEDELLRRAIEESKRDAEAFQRATTQLHRPTGGSFGPAASRIAPSTPGGSARIGGSGGVSRYTGAAPASTAAAAAAAPVTLPSGRVVTTRVPVTNTTATSRPSAANGTTAARSAGYGGGAGRTARPATPTWR